MTILVLVFRTYSIMIVCMDPPETLHPRLSTGNLFYTYTKSTIGTQKTLTKPPLQGTEPFPGAPSIQNVLTLGSKVYRILLTLAYL